MNKYKRIEQLFNQSINTKQNCKEQGFASLDQIGYSLTNTYSGKGAVLNACLEIIKVFKVKI